VATTRFTIGAALSAVSESAATITNTMTAVNTALGMANTFVNRAADNQRIRYAMESIDQTKQIADELALEMVKRDDVARKYLNGDQELLETFNDYHAQLMAAAQAIKP
jgi:hypothetical protein